MPLPHPIQENLDKYDHRKKGLNEILKKVIPDHSCIRALKNLPPERQNDRFAIFSCFASELKLGRPHYAVYHSVVTHYAIYPEFVQRNEIFLIILNQLKAARLLNLVNFDMVITYADPRQLARLLRGFKNAGALNQASLDALMVDADPNIAYFIGLLNKIDPQATAIFPAMISHDNPKAIVRILTILKDHNCLNQAPIKTIINDPIPNSLALALKILITRNLINEKMSAGALTLDHLLIQHKIILAQYWRDYLIFLVSKEIHSSPHDFEGITLPFDIYEDANFFNVLINEFKKLDSAIALFCLALILESRLGGHHEVKIGNCCFLEVISLHLKAREKDRVFAKLVPPILQKILHNPNFIPIAPPAPISPETAHTPGLFPTLRETMIGNQTREQVFAELNSSLESYFGVRP